MLRRLASLALCLCACVDRSTADDVGADATASETSSAAPTTTSATSDVTTSTTASEDATDAAPTTGGPSCEGYTIPIVIPLVTLSLTLVIDQSPAMLDPWDHDGDPQTPDLPRWTSVRDVLLAVLSPLESVRLGLAPYPTPDADDGDGATACAETPALLVPTSDDPPPDVLAGLAPADPPGGFSGGAPLRRALAAAVAGNDGPLDQPRALAVFANSAANCSPEAAGPALLESLDVGVLDAAAAAQAAGLPVYVFGIGASTDPSPALVDRRPDGVVVSDALKDLAAAGGGAYIPVHSEAELAASLAAFFASEPDTTCTLSLDPQPGPGQAVTRVTIGDVAFPPVKDCATQDGWRVVDDALELCGAACLQFGAQGGLEIEVSCVG